MNKKNKYNEKNVILCRQMNVFSWIIDDMPHEIKIKDLETIKLKSNSDIINNLEKNIYDNQIFMKIYAEFLKLMENTELQPLFIKEIKNVLFGQICNDNGTLNIRNGYEYYRLYRTKDIFFSHLIIVCAFYLEVDPEYVIEIIEGQDYYDLMTICYFMNDLFSFEKEYFHECKENKDIMTNVIAIRNLTNDKLFINDITNALKMLKKYHNCRYYRFCIFIDIVFYRKKY